MWQFTLETAPLSFLGQANGDYLGIGNTTIALGLPANIEVAIQGRPLLRITPSSANASAARRALLVDTLVVAKFMVREGTLQAPGRRGTTWPTLIDAPQPSEPRGPSLALELQVLLPQLADGGDATRFGTNGILALSQLWRHAALHTNIAVGLGRARAVTFFGGLAVEGPWRWPARPVAELTIEYDAGAGEQWAFSGTVGALVPINENLWLDFGARHGSDGANEAFEVVAGVNWAFTPW